MPGTPDRLDQLMADIKAEFPRFRLIRKDESASQRLIQYQDEMVGRAVNDIARPVS